MDFKKKAAVDTTPYTSETNKLLGLQKVSVRVFSQGKEYTVKAGGVLIIPPYVPHEFHALEDTIDIDFFSPVREDWLNNTASYIQTIQKKE